ARLRRELQAALRSFARSAVRRRCTRAAERNEKSHAPGRNIPAARFPGAERFPRATKSRSPEFAPAEFQERNERAVLHSLRCFPCPPLCLSYSRRSLTCARRPAPSQPTSNTRGNGADTKSRCIECTPDAKNHDPITSVKVLKEEGLQFSVCVRTW